MPIARPMAAVARVIFMLAAYCGAVPSISAQSYPARPLRIIVTSAPGGGSDFMARIAAQRLTEALGQQVIVENRPGIGAQAGNEYGMGFTPDGYTMTIVTPSYTINSSIRASKFDPLTQYTPIIMLGKGPIVVLTHPLVPARNARELVTLAKSQPGELAYGTSGQGTIIHLSTALFLLLADVKMLHVPYKGGGPALVDLMGGRVQVVFTPPQTGMPYVRSGKLRAIAMTSAERSKSEPEIPTLAESGVPGYEASNWHALIAPRGLPRPIHDRLNGEMRKIVASGEFGKTLLANGVEPAGGTPAELHEYVRRDFYKWRKVIQDANVRIE
jgi:tripartite-type tricarboxylate transporter receptor subunit TctC